MAKLKEVAKVFVLVCCMGFVSWQTASCFSKFLSSPEGTSLSMKFIGGQAFPLITVCPSKDSSISTRHLRYNLEKLKECGIFRVESYTKDGKWVGIGHHENCTDAEQLHENIVIKVEDLIHSIGYTRYGYIKLISWKPAMPSTKKLWVPMDNREHARCFTIHHPKSYLQEGIAKIRILTYMDTQVYLHSPGMLESVRHKVKLDLDLNDKVEVDVEHEVHKVLDTEETPCADGSEYSKDECAHQRLYRESMDTFGCITPFGRAKDYICTNLTAAKESNQLYGAYFDGYKASSSCLNSCTYLSIRAVETKRVYSGNTANGKKTAIMYLYFRENIKVTHGFYVYSGLSLIAEIGGYVGLFLGVSVYQITSLLDYISS